VVAAAALGDVVKQPGKVKHFRALELREQPAAEGILVRHLRIAKRRRLRTTIRICSSTV